MASYYPGVGGHLNFETKTPQIHLKPVFLVEKNPQLASRVSGQTRAQGRRRKPNFLEQLLDAEIRNGTDTFLLRG